jgi:hypothetical protein
MAPRPTPNLLSIILPTYNEADNLPIVIWLIVRELQKRRARARACARTHDRICLAFACPPRPLTLRAAPRAARAAGWRSR